MIHQSLPIHSLLALGAGALSVSLSAEAQACSGLQQTELLSVPNSDSEPMSLDTQPVVIGGSSRLTLRSADGTNVPISVVDLGQVQRPGLFPGASPHWQGYTVRQIQPIEMLEPSTEYIVGASGPSFGERNPPAVGSADAGVGGFGDIGRFVTAANAAVHAEPLVPSDLALRFYSFGSGNSASCSGSGQLEVDGWQDNTLLELCVEYFTYTRYVEPTFDDGDLLDDRPKQRTSCWLAWRPSAHVLEEIEPVLWVETVSVRAFGLGGRISSTVVFERSELDQFNAAEGDDGLAVEPFTPLQFPAPELEAREREKEPAEGNGGEFMPTESTSEAGTGTSPASDESAETLSSPSSSANGGCSMVAARRHSPRGSLLLVLLLGAMRRRRCRGRQTVVPRPRQ